MIIAIAMGDARFPRLCDMLAEDGYQARMAVTADDLIGAQALIGAYPFDDALAEGLSGLAPGARLILLPARTIPDTLINSYDVCALSDDVAFALENAVFTAEGAICAAMTRAPFALAGENAMVIGFGRIGRALTEMLVGLRARVTVVSRRESGRLQAMARGARAADLSGMRRELPDARVIFVTSPERVLTRDDMVYISRGAFLYDLSGAPHGADMDAAKAMGLNARLESALPGRYCPESAARAMYRAVTRVLGGGERL